MQDYSSIGIVSMEDRKRLFQLIQTLKSDSLIPQPIKQEVQKLPDIQSSALVQQPISQPVVQSSTQQYQQTVLQQTFHQSLPQPTPVSYSQERLERVERSQDKQQSTRLLNAYGIPLSSSQATQPSQNKINKSDKIKVCVRLRPLSKKEIKRNESTITNCVGKRSLVINEPK